MSTMTVEIPANIRKHLEDVISVFGLERSEETMNTLIQGWLEKEDSFREKMFDLGMEETGHFDKDDERGIMALTYSGSLISIGPIVEGDRKVDYTSIGFRRDVPGTLTKEGALLAESLELNKGVVFDGGPIKKTSPIYKIVACPDSLSSEEQEDLIDQASTMIIENFAEINNDTIVLE